MIKLRLNAFSNTIDVESKDSETLNDLAIRTLMENGHKEVNDNVLQHIAILINAVEVDRDMWHIVVYKETDEVLISSVIRGGSFGQIFKSVAIIAITIAASYFLGPAGAGLSGAALGASVAAVSIGATLLLNSLIPPPSLGGGLGFGASGNSLESSQMYSITGQSNKVNKLGFVPKLYGFHRMFPTVAANPYTEIETDPSTGNLVQFFYCIYDFGHGPISIKNIKIGDTFIEDYSDVVFSLVDFNKPAISEGYWDDALTNVLNFYKGDIEQDNSSIAINKNEESGGALEDYQVIRNASARVNGNLQEIILDFVCPNGLIGYGTNGDTSAVNIDLEIYFSKVGEDIWKPYNDPDFVSNYSYAGGSPIYTNTDATTKPLIAANYTLLSSNIDYAWVINYGTIAFNRNNYGYPAGTSSFVLSDGSADIGDILIANGVQIGKVLTKTFHSSGFSTYVTDAGLATSLLIFTTNTDPLNPGGPTTITGSTTGKIFRKFLILGKARISRQDANVVYSTIKFSPIDISQYKVRITRIRTTSDVSFQIQSNLTLASLVTRFDRDPILTDKRHVFLELKIRATNQLNGSVQNLSAEAQSILDVYDPDTMTWSKQATSNPAWVFCDLLTGQSNKKAVDRSRLHLPSIVEWAEFADEVPTPPPFMTYTAPRFQCNFVLDFEATLQQVLNLICNAAQASLNISDGKYGVLLDKLKTIPVQVFTPRNSSDFSSTRNYAETPNVLKVKFVEPSADWEVRERLVYEDGFDADTAITEDELDSFACTNEEQAWRFGRYMMAQAKLRQENITINVDFEHLVCTRGDYVRYVQDVMKVGGRAARVKTVSGIRITIDDFLDTLPVDYGYMFRGASGIYESTLTVINGDTFDLDGTMPSVGDLIVIGEVDFIYIDCLVKAISPQSDLTAQLTLIEKADAIYTVESTGTIPEYSAQIAPTENTEFAAPGPVENLQIINNTYRCLGSGYQYYIDLDWDVPQGAAYSIFEIYADNGKGYNFVAFTKESFYEYIVSESSLGIVHNFKILAVSASGKKLDLGTVPFVTATPLNKTSPPSDIVAINLNVTDQTIQMDWKAIDDCDLFEYIIRFAPNYVGTWESSIPLLRVDRRTTLAQAQARVGTYLIKAVDFNGNESATAAIAITSIPYLTGLNIIDETNDFPDLEGNLVQTVNEGDALLLQKVVSGDPTVNEYYSEGFYYFKNFLDLGEIYTVRLQSLIEAEGFTVDDIMSNWLVLSDLVAMSNSNQSDWDVETQYRATDQFNVMSEWTQLSLVDPISDGQTDNWTAWKKFTIGDFAGRIFQFRLRLISNKASVTPRVFNGVIRSDMPDRFESDNNLVATPAGYVVTYNTPFMGPGTSPNIQITQDGAQSGDYYLFNGTKTLNGFTITFYDKNDIAVTRTFDWAAKGYGRKTTAVI